MLSLALLYMELTTLHGFGQFERGLPNGTFLYAQTIVISFELYLP